MLKSLLGIKGLSECAFQVYCRVLAGRIEKKKTAIDDNVTNDITTLNRVTLLH